MAFKNGSSPFSYCSVEALRAATAAVASWAAIRRMLSLTVCEQRLILFVRSYPIPQDRTRLSLDTNRTVVATDPHRHDWFCRMYPFEVKAGMPWVLSEKQIGRDGLFAYVPWETSQELAE